MILNRHKLRPGKDNEIILPASGPKGFFKKAGVLMDRFKFINQ